MRIRARLSLPTRTAIRTKATIMTEAMATLCSRAPDQRSTSCSRAHLSGHSVAADCLCEAALHVGRAERGALVLAD